MRYAIAFFSEEEGGFRAMCRRGRLLPDFRQSFYGVALDTVQIPGLTPALRLCSREGRQFAILTLSDVDGVKWEIVPAHWQRYAQGQSGQRAGKMWRIAPLQWSEEEIPGSLRLARRRTDGCRGWYDPGESAPGTIEGALGLLAWIGDQEQEEWETRVVAYSTGSLERGEVHL